MCTDAELHPHVYIRVSLADLTGTARTQLESATCLWFPQLWKHFWNGWSHRGPGDKDVTGTGEHPITAGKGHELQLGSFWQIREFYSSSVVWRNREVAPIGKARAGNQNPSDSDLHGEAQVRKGCKPRGSCTQAAPSRVHPSISPPGDTAAPSRCKGNVLYILFQ